MLQHLTCLLRRLRLGKGKNVRHLASVILSKIVLCVLQYAIVLTSQISKGEHDRRSQQTPGKPLQRFKFSTVPHHKTLI